MYSMYVSYVCVLCMYFMYVFYLCILCMYSTYAFRIFVCKASWLSRPPGAKIHEKQHLRIQEGHFLKSALNLDLTLSDDGECRTFFDSPRNYWFRCFLRRVMVILLQQKNFGPNVIYFVFELQKVVGGRDRAGGGGKDHLFFIFFTKVWYKIQE